MATDQEILAAAQLVVAKATALGAADTQAQADATAAKTADAQATLSAGAAAQAKTGLLDSVAALEAVVSPPPAPVPPATPKS